MSEQKALQEQKLILGIIFVLLSGLFYSVYSLLAKEAQENGINFWQISFFTFSISWLVICPYLLIKQRERLKTTQFSWHFFRSVFGLSIIYFFVISLQSIPLVDSVMLNNSAPLFIPFIAYFILKIPINHKLWWAMGLGFLGIGLILRPDSQVFKIGGVWGLLSAISMAFSWVSIRKLTYSEPVTRIVFYFLTIATVITAVPLLWEWKPLTSSAWLFLLLIGLSYLSCSVTFTLAAKIISITMVGMLYYSVIIFTVLLNWLVFHQFPDAITIGGILLITTGGILSVWIEGRKLK